MAPRRRAPPTIFEGENLKSGVYKIQNLHTENYLDIHLHSMEVCCRPANNLADGRGLWEIRRFGDGYAVWRVDPGRPPQFCSPMNGLQHGAQLFVTAYPGAWRIERAQDAIYRGFEYVRIHWGPTKITWDLWVGNKDNGAPVKLAELNQNTWQVWRLIPEEATTPQPLYEALGLGPLPPYDENEPEQPPAHVQHVEQERDDFGTVVTEVTIVTTRKKYRVEDA